MKHFPLLLVIPHHFLSFSPPCRSGYCTTSSCAVTGPLTLSFSPQRTPTLTPQRTPRLPPPTLLLAHLRPFYPQLHRWRTTVRRWSSPHASGLLRRQPRWLSRSIQRGHRAPAINPPRVGDPIPCGPRAPKIFPSGALVPLRMGLCRAPSGQTRLAKSARRLYYDGRPTGSQLLVKRRMKKISARRDPTPTRLRPRRR